MLDAFAATNESFVRVHHGQPNAIAPDQFFYRIKIRRTLTVLEQIPSSLLSTAPVDQALAASTADGASGGWTPPLLIRGPSALVSPTAVSRAGYQR